MMTPRLAACLLALGLAAATPLALAEAPPAPGAGPLAKGPLAGERKGPRKGAMMRREPPESFTEQSVRTMADGRVFKRTVEQKVAPGSFSRKEVITNPDGKSATRTLSATLSKDGKTWTRKIEGTDFDGKTWQRSRDVPAQHGPDGDGEDEAGPQAAPRPDGKKPR